MWRDEAYLLDILIATRKILKFTQGIDHDKFSEDDILQNAVMRLLEVMGEAARKISEEMKKSQPAISWNEMIGMRNHLIHEYFRIDVELVWNTIQNDLPLLLKQIEPLVPAEETKKDGNWPAS